MNRYFRFVLFTDTLELYTKWMDVTTPVSKILKFVDYVKGIAVNYDIQYAYTDDKDNLIIEQGR